MNCANEFGPIASCPRRQDEYISAANAAAESTWAATQNGQHLCCPPAAELFVFLSAFEAQRIYPSFLRSAPGPGRVQEARICCSEGSFAATLPAMAFKSQRPQRLTLAVFAIAVAGQSWPQLGMQVQVKVKQPCAESTCNQSHDPHCRKFNGWSNPRQVTPKASRTLPGRNTSPLTGPLALWAWAPEAARLAQCSMRSVRK